MDFNQLLESLDKISIVSNSGGERISSTIQCKPFSDRFLEKAAALIQESEKQEKKIDPNVQKHRESLPIFYKKAALLKAMEQNQVLIIIGETGSGKTTQIPQYLKEIGMTSKGRIGCTQLRRMAAKSVAKRVAREQGVKLGEEVGYTIRFEDVTNGNTQIQYMTDGILLRECVFDRMLTSYSAIILDESHERSIDTDILLGTLRWIIQKRSELKLIISSATIDAGKFSSYFFSAAVFNISGRMFPVEVIYNPSLQLYVDNAFRTVIRINETQPKGDILVFMSGEQDIGDLEDLLLDYRSSLHPTLVIRPCYSALSWEEQALIFEPVEPSERKVVIATNIAETSITVNGILYVIDSGFVKQKVYNPKKDIEELKMIRVSQAQAIQRTGRAGRVAPGKCYRLYSKHEFDLFVSGPDPEIKRSSLTSPVLLLKRMGFNNLNDFVFLDPPSEEILQHAEDELKFFGALDQNGFITEVGKKMAGFPLDPNLSKMLIVSEELGCAEEILTIVALLSVPHIFIRKRKFAKKADAAKARFITADGDLIMMLNVYQEWVISGRSKEWCFMNYVQNRVLNDASQIREQLRELMIARNMTVRSAINNRRPVLKSIYAGFVQNVARKVFSVRRDTSYETIPNRQIVQVHPGSALYKFSPPYVAFQKVLQTTKPYMHGLTPIEQSWMKEFQTALANYGQLPLIQSNF